MQLIDQPNRTFTKSELERLEVYRAAVAAGFYTDWDDSVDREASDPEIASTESSTPPEKQDA